MEHIKNVLQLPKQFFHELSISDTVANKEYRKLLKEFPKKEAHLETVYHESTKIRKFNVGKLSTIAYGVFPGDIVLLFSLTYSNFDKEYTLNGKMWEIKGMYDDANTIYKLGFKQNTGIFLQGWYKSKRQKHLGRCGIPANEFLSKVIIIKRGVFYKKHIKKNDTLHTLFSNLPHIKEVFMTKMKLARKAKEIHKSFERNPNVRFQDDIVPYMRNNM